MPISGYLLNGIAMVTILATSIIAAGALTQFGIFGIAQGQGNLTQGNVTIGNVTYTPRQGNVTIGNVTYTPRQGNVTIGNVTYTPEQIDAICNPNNPLSKLNPVNTTESRICGIPVTVKPPTNTTSTANTTTTTGTETPPGNLAPSAVPT